jgi:ABC-type uncharacterized transport system auxiliary subunit
MKRFLSLLLVFLMCFSLAGCGGGADHTGQAKTPSGSSVQKGRDYQDVLKILRNTALQISRQRKLMI